MSTTNPGLLAHQLHRFGPVGASRNYFSAICPFHPTGTPCSFDKPKLSDFQPRNCMVYPFALTPTWSFSSDNSCALPPNYSPSLQQGQASFLSPHGG